MLTPEREKQIRELYAFNNEGRGRGMPELLEEIDSLREKLSKWQSVLEINHDYMYPDGKCEICDLLKD